MRANKPPEDILAAAQALLVPLAADAAPYCWIDGVDDDVTCYCPECGEKGLARLREEFPEGTETYGEPELVVGHDAQEDSSAFCSVCGKVLEHHLTDCGARDELAHFEDGELEWPLGAIDAYCLSVLFDAYWEQAEWAPRMVKLARTVVREARRK